MRPAPRRVRTLRAAVLRPTVLHAAMLAALLLPLYRPAAAATFVWNGNSVVLPTAWSNPLNWNGGFSPLSADDTALRFPNSFVASNNDIAAGFRLNRITAFDNNGLGGLGTIGGQSITLGGADAQIHVGAAGTLVINAPLAGSVAWRKTGAGELTLGGSNLALAGDLTIEAGRLNAVNSGNLGTGAVTLNAGASLRTGGAPFIAGIAGAGSWQADGATTLTVGSGERSFAGSVTGGGSMIKSGTGRQIFAGNVTSGGSVTVGGGELALAGSTAIWGGATSLAVANAATASVSGGARWTVIGPVTVGGGSAFANGNLNIGGSGSVLTGLGGTLGNAGSERGAAAVSAGGRWTNNGALVIGNAGTGRLDVSGFGSAATALNTTVGALAGSSGTLALDQAGSFAAGSALTVGASGSGNVTLSGGSVLSSTTGVIGQNIGGSGSVALAGAGSSWNTTGGITVGNQGQGTLSLDGAQGSASNGMVLGAEPLSSGRLNLSNASSWGVAGGSLVVGQRGNGVAFVSGGSVLTTRGAVIGLTSGQGEAHVDGFGQWTNLGTMVIGSATPGWLFLESGGRLTSGDTTIGLLPPSGGPGGGQSRSGTVLADAASWTVNGELRVADGGSARMELRGGTQLTSATANTAVRAGSSAEILLSGAGTARTTWTNSGDFFVGAAGPANIGLAGAATLDTGRAYVGGGSVVTLDNAAADLPSWNVRGVLSVGNTGDGGGGVLVRHGTLSSAGGNIGAWPGGSGSVTLASPQALWTIDGNLSVGTTYTGATALLVLNNGGQLRAAGALDLLPSGVVTLASQSLLSVASLVPGSSGRLNWTGGTLEITGPGGVTLGSTPYLGRVLSLAGDQTLAVTKTLAVGSGTIVLSDTAQVRAGLVSLDGGQIVGRSVLELDHSSISGHGLVGIEVQRGAADSVIEAKGGTLMVGDPSSGNGFSSAGSMIVQPESRLVLMSAARVDLGSLAKLEAGSQLQTFNGAQLMPGALLRANGNATVLGRFANLGQVEGPTDPGTALSFNDDVSGPGRFGGNVRFLQHYAPEAGAQLQHLDLADTATLVLGDLGTAARSAAPLQVAGLAALGGRLELQLAGGFVPGAEGAVFELVDWGRFSGSFAGFTVDGLDAGWTSELRYDADALRLSISAVPEPASWLAMLGGAALLLARRRLHGARAG